MRYTDADEMSKNVIHADKPPQNEWFVTRLVREAFSPRVDPVNTKPFPFPEPQVDLTQFKADADEIRRNMEKNKLPVDANGKLIFPPNSLNIGQDWLDEQLKNPPKPQKEESITPLEIPPLENPPKGGDACRPSQNNELGSTESIEDAEKPVENSNPNELKPIRQSADSIEQTIEQRQLEPKFLDMSSPY